MEQSKCSTGGSAKRSVEIDNDSSPSKRRRLDINNVDKSKFPTINDILTKMRVGDKMEFLGLVVKMEEEVIKMTRGGKMSPMKKVLLTDNGEDEIFLTIWGTERTLSPVAEKSVLFIKMATLIEFNSQKLLTAPRSMVAVNPSIPEARMLKNLPIKTTPVNREDVSVSMTSKNQFFQNRFANYKFVSIKEIETKINVGTKIDFIGLVVDVRDQIFCSVSNGENTIREITLMDNTGSQIVAAIYSKDYDNSEILQNFVIFLKTATIVSWDSGKRLSVARFNVWVNPTIPEAEEIKKLIKTVSVDAENSNVQTKEKIEVSIPACKLPYTPIADILKNSPEKSVINVLGVVAFRKMLECKIENGEKFEQMKVTLVDQTGQTIWMKLSGPHASLMGSIKLDFPIVEGLKVLVVIVQGSKRLICSRSASIFNIEPNNEKARELQRWFKSVWPKTNVGKASTSTTAAVINKNRPENSLNSVGEKEKHEDLPNSDVEGKKLENSSNSVDEGKKRENLSNSVVEGKKLENSSNSDVEGKNRENSPNCVVKNKTRENLSTSVVEAKKLENFSNSDAEDKKRENLSNSVVEGNKREHSQNSVLKEKKSENLPKSVEEGKRDHSPNLFDDDERESLPNSFNEPERQFLPNSAVEGKNRENFTNSVNEAESQISPNSIKKEKRHNSPNSVVNENKTENFTNSVVENGNDNLTNLLRNVKFTPIIDIHVNISVDSIINVIGAVHVLGPLHIVEYGNGKTSCNRIVTIVDDSQKSIHLKIFNTQARSVECGVIIAVTNVKVCAKKCLVPSINDSVCLVNPLIEKAETLKEWYRINAIDKPFVEIMLPITSNAEIFNKFNEGDQTSIIGILKKIHVLNEMKSDTQMPENLVDVWRKIELVDQTEVVIAVILWGDIARNFEFPIGSILLITNVRVSVIQEKRFCCCMGLSKIIAHPTEEKIIDFFNRLQIWSNVRTLRSLETPNDIEIVSTPTNTPINNLTGILMDDIREFYLQVPIKIQPMNCLDSEKFKIVDNRKENLISQNNEEKKFIKTEPEESFVDEIFTPFDSQIITQDIPCSNEVFMVKEEIDIPEEIDITEEIDNAESIDKFPYYSYVDGIRDVLD